MRLKTSLNNLRKQPIQALLTVTLVFCVAYAIATKTPHDFFIFVGIPTVLLTLGFGGMSVRLMHDLKRDMPEDFPTNPKYFFRFLQKGLSVALISYGVLVSMLALLKWIVAAPSAAGAGVTLLMGLLLYWFRRNFRFLYGASEVFAGVFIAAYRTHTFSSAANADLAIVLLTAGIYVVVRGFDNMEHGLKHPGSDIFVKWYKRDDQESHG